VAGVESQPLLCDRCLCAYHRLAAVVAGQQLDPFRTTGVVRQGDAAEAITEYAREMRADLIVMGIRGQEQARPDSPGRVIQRVLGCTTGPVTAVPEPGLKHAPFQSPVERNAVHAPTWRVA
jgi:K+-sensing histidine kinase KdpD